jgi:hypothetical protein
VITGFNTDIEFEGVTYHVQTEDKGLATPLILSLVYDRGTILASKRSPYNDLLIAGFNETDLKDRLNRQHKLMCAAIRAGRIEDLKRMTMKESASKKQGLIAQKEVKLTEKFHPIAIPENPLPVAFREKPKAAAKPAHEEIPAPQILNEDKRPPAEFVNQKVESATKNATALKNGTDKQSNDEIWDIPISIIDEFIVEEVEIVEIIEEETILPSEAVEIITDFSKHEEPDTDQLSIELLNDVMFRGSENRTISVLVSRNMGQNNQVGVNVMIKILGTTFRAQIFHAKTDSNGVAIVQIQFPTFSRGRAAILIKASSGGEDAELRRVIQPG